MYENRGSFLSELHKKGISVVEDGMGHGGDDKDITEVWYNGWVGTGGGNIAAGAIGQSIVLEDLERNYE